MGVRSGPKPAKAAEEWPHRPAYFCAHSSVSTTDYAPGEPLPLGAPVEFETDLFEGRVFCRLKPISNGPDYDQSSHESYFAVKKRRYQFIFQGQFKKEHSLSDLVLGDFYDKKFNGIPEGAVGVAMVKVYEKFMQTISPGMTMDMTSDNPKILTALGSCQTMNVSLKGEEPDISTGTFEENTVLLFGKQKFESSNKRRAYLSKPKNSAKYKTNPDHVYTIELYDHTMCFGSYYQHVMGGKKIDMAETINGQPLAFAMFTKDEQMLCKFPIWHERLIEKMDQSQESKQ